MNWKELQKNPALITPYKEELYKKRLVEKYPDMTWVERTSAMTEEERQIRMLGSSRERGFVMAYLEAFPDDPWTPMKLYPAMMKAHYEKTGVPLLD
jgi:hypothetical protein